MPFRSVGVSQEQFEKVARALGPELLQSLVNAFTLTPVALVRSVFAAENPDNPEEKVRKIDELMPVYIEEKIAELLQLICDELDTENTRKEQIKAIQLAIIEAGTSVAIKILNEVGVHPRYSISIRKD